MASVKKSFCFRFVLGLLFCSFTALSFEQHNVAPVIKKIDTSFHSKQIKSSLIKATYKDVRKDSIGLQGRKSTAQEFKSIKQKYNTTEFNYTEEKYKGSSFWDRVGKWIKDFFSSIAPDVNINFAKMMIYLLYGIGGFAILFIIYKILINKRQNFFRQPKEEDETEVRFVEKNLFSIDIQEYIDKAKRDKNWNLAIRYLQLQILKLLALKNLIEWDFRKTNQAFLYEIKDDKIRADFKNTTSVFNYVWYGDFKMDDAKFKTLQAMFINLKNKLS